MKAVHEVFVGDGVGLSHQFVGQADAAFSQVIIG